jgi:acyl-CoA synthetase (AMP-forming)/AMP-acid ligase II
VSDAGPPERQTIPDLVEQRAKEFGPEPLLQFEDQTYSYREIDRRANRMANALLDHGVSEGDVVSVFLENSPHYLTLWFSIAKIGALMLPINVDHRDETLSHILRDSAPGTIVVDEQTRENYETVRDEFSGNLLELAIGEIAGHRYRRFDDLAAEYGTEPPDREIDPGDPMGIIYTSGSSGRPKGVVLPHYSYVNTGWEYSRNIFDMDADDRLFTTLPIFHCNAQQTTVIGAMIAGTDFVLEASFTPESFWQRIREHGVTHFNYLGSMIPLLYKQDERPDDADNPARYGIGAAAPVEIIEDFEDRFDVTLIEGYGLTETATVATVNRPDARRVGSVGKSLSYTRVDIVDEHDNPIPAGEVGEIVVRPTRANTMMTGYYNRPNRTVEAWQNLWFHTGDLGYKDEDGYVYFVDRKEYAISKQNETISSFEIERVITEHSDIQEVSVFGVPNERGEEDIKAVVLPKPEVNITPVDIIEHCEEHLPYFKLPRYVELVAKLPKTPTERVKKYKLKQEGNNDSWDRENGYELIG